MTEIVLILDNIRSIQNTATLFRTADCFGVSELCLCGTTPAPIDRFGRTRENFTKISLGSELSVPWNYQSDTLQAVHDYKERGYEIYILEQSDDSIPLHTLAPSNTKIALVLGNEVDGVQSELLNSGNSIIEIKQFGKKESLNVAIAGSIGLYHLRFITGSL